MSDDIMAASANRPTPTPELLRCNAKVIRQWAPLDGQYRRSQQTKPLSDRSGAGGGLFGACASSQRVPKRQSRVSSHFQFVPFYSGRDASAWETDSGSSAV